MEKLARFFYVIFSYECCSKSFMNPLLMYMVVIVVFTAYYNFLSALCGQGSQQATQDDHKQNKERHFVFGFVSAFVICTYSFIQKNVPDETTTTCLQNKGHYVHSK